MLSGMLITALLSLVSWYSILASSICLRPKNQRKEADHAKALLTIPESIHLTLLSVYDLWVQSA